MHLFFQGYPLRAIAELLQTPEGTVSTWKKRDGWDDIKPIDRVDFAIEARMCQLIAKEVKTGGDFKEIDLLGRQLERIAATGGLVGLCFAGIFIDPDPEKVTFERLMDHLDHLIEVAGTDHVGLGVKVDF